MSRWVKKREIMKRNCRKRNSIGQIYKFIIIAIAGLLILHSILENTSLYYRKIYISPLSLHLNSNDIVLAKGEEFKLRVIGINKRVTYSTTNFRVAGVNFNGRVFAYQTGKAFIIVKVDKKVLKCRVRVLNINKEKLTLSVGDTYRLKLLGSAGLPSYKSSEPEVATVNWRGKITAKNKGKTVISAEAKGKTFHCTVTVK
jgi:uncharacterized protein YjdB